VSKINLKLGLEVFMFFFFKTLKTP